MRFCAAPDATPRLAVLGVLGIEAHSATRTAIRDTWLHTGEASGILARFVLRGIGAKDATQAEASQHGDIIFVESESAQMRNSGPLMSLVQWLDCALIAFPRTQLVGKGEEDTWLHLPGLASRLRLDLRALQLRQRQQQSTKDDHHRSSAPSVYWGVQETFHWELAAQRPLGFHYKFGNSADHCVVREFHISGLGTPSMRKTAIILPHLPEPPYRTANITTVGPFSYAKGPVVFVSRSAVESAMKPTSWARQNLKQIIDDERTIARPDGNDVPYDDVWLGLALATSLSASDAGSNGDAGKVTAVHIGAVALAEGIPGQARGPYTFQTTTLAWHNAHALNKLDSRRSTSAGDVALAARIRAVHAIGHSKRHCDTPDVLLNCQGKQFKAAARGITETLQQQPEAIDPRSLYRSCAGTLWERCLVVHNYTACNRKPMGLYEPTAEA